MNTNVRKDSHQQNTIKKLYTEGGPGRFYDLLASESLAQQVEQLSAEHRNRLFSRH